MSENLSFTQELRNKGLIIGNPEDKSSDDVVNQKVEENTVETENNTTNTIREFDESYGPKDLLFIGQRPSMSYVLAVKARMDSGIDKVTIRARGRTISKAVDIAEIVTNRFVPEANDDEIKILTEKTVKENGSKSNISAIEIVIQR